VDSTKWTLKEGKSLSQTLKPYSTILDFKTGVIKSYKKEARVKLSVLREFFNDREAVDQILSSGEDPVVYEYFEHSQPEVEGQINFGVTTMYPGKVGKEYYLTRGHYHAKENATELYMGLTGEGIMIMQTKDGESLIYQSDRVTLCTFHRSGLIAQLT